MRLRAKLLMVGGILIFGLIVMPPSAFPITCEMLGLNVDDARSNLRRAANETGFEEAKDYARRAKRSLDDAAMSAMNCGCDMAFVEFDTAATHAKRARHANTSREFVDSLNRAIKAFNSAIEALQICGRKRR